MAKEINVLVVEPGKPPRPARVGNTLKNFEQIVGGPVETGCFLPQRVMLVCRDRKDASELPPNRCTARRVTVLSLSRRCSRRNFNSILPNLVNL